MGRRSTQPFNASAFDLEGYLKSHSRTIDTALSKILTPPRTPWGTELSRLHGAMRYGVFPGGKRLRPILTLAACEAVGGQVASALPVACAIEMIHTYSLIHDDLPAMDNSDLRRGKGTCHKVFGEALAILAGDGLLTFAFQILSENTSNLPSDLALRIIDTISHAVGPEEMIAGQVLDIAASRPSLNAARLDNLEQRKTGALIRASLVAGALAGGVSRAKRLEDLAKFGENLGLAFQVVDDILDITATAEEIGKQVGQDARHDKTTFATLYGAEGARNKARHLAATAVRTLRRWGPKADPLRAIAEWVPTRSR